MYKRKKVLFFLLIIAWLVGFFVSTFSYSSVMVCGVDISGLSFKKAIVKANTEIEQICNDINITLTFEDQIFHITHNDLKRENSNKVVKNAIDEAMPTFFDKINILKKKSQKIVVPTINFFCGFEQVIEQIRTKVERPMQEPRVSFFPNKKNMFVADDGIVGVRLDKNELKSRIAYALEQSTCPTIALPVIFTKPTKTKKEVISAIVKRSTFSTSYSSSVGGRKFNVKLSLSAFNGMVVEKNEIVSFNQTITNKIPSSQFRVAKIIVGGEFVDGRGGGMCQASTTLYNALLLANLDILKVRSHTLPVGYVKLGFDAMVNPGSADLIFQNTTDSPLYICAYGDEKECYVDIYGEAMPKGLVVKRKSEFLCSLKHGGDKIIPDKEQKFQDKILFQGEYYRVKYPVEGIESNSYLQFFIDGELVEERLIRHNRYNSQQGIVYEGIEPLPDDSVAPSQPASFIEPQSQTQTNEQNVEEKIKIINPPHFSQ